MQDDDVSPDDQAVSDGSVNDGTGLRALAYGVTFFLGSGLLLGALLYFGSSLKLETHELSVQCGGFAVRNSETNCETIIRDMPKFAALSDVEILDSKLSEFSSIGATFVFSVSGESGSLVSLRNRLVARDYSFSFDE